ncbi:MAG: hypothetical protein JW738_08100 [Actinobacteria bacterium]|nr:hypothetical protein [Actinomycetota bacterium]
MNIDNLPDGDQSSVPAKDRRKDGKFRSFVVWSLIILASICAFGSSLVIWINITTLNTENFVNTVAPLVQDDAVAKAVSIKAVDMMWNAYNLEGKIEESATFLPKEYQFLSEPVSAGAKTAAQMAGEEILKSNQFQSVWREVIKEAHSTGMRALRDEGPVAISQEGEAVLDLDALIGEIKTDLVGMGLTFLKDVKVEGVGEVVLFRSEQLGSAKIGIDTIEVLCWLLPILALALFIAAILISLDNRKALMRSGVGLAIAMGIVLISLWVSKVVTLSRLSTVNSEAVNVIWNHLESGLKWIDLSLLIFGVVVIIGCMIAGPSKWAVKLRGLFKPKRA